MCRHDKKSEVWLKNGAIIRDLQSAGCFLVNYLQTGTTLPPLLCTTRVHGERCRLVLI
ncbi:hypothetical protein HMPREF0476_0695 [Kingella kingae ATCC 23330]|uniref:Uncharacterized protein n=1 Tax=Kingella kingae ATCC 23330 TaxID=887327 RepID=F5S662_KINKI|nr:hypothetical protein HMPREF0476_0695 [Kingella kingae ATCC 23330]